MAEMYYMKMKFEPACLLVQCASIDLIITGEEAWTILQILPQFA